MSFEWFSFHIWTELVTLFPVYSGFSHEIVPITVFFVLWSRKLYHWIKSRNKSDFPVVLGKLYTDIYNLPRFFVQDLCENTPQRPLNHQKCRFRRSIYIFYSLNVNEWKFHSPIEWNSCKPLKKEWFCTLNSKFPLIKSENHSKKSELPLIWGVKRRTTRKRIVLRLTPQTSGNSLFLESFSLYMSGNLLFNVQNHSFWVVYKSFTLLGSEIFTRLHLESTITLFHKIRDFYTS